LELKALLKRLSRAVLEGALFKGEFKGSMFVGRDVAEILRDLERCESHSGFFEKPPQKRLVFHDPSNEAVVCSFLERMVQFKVWSIAFLYAHYSIKNIFVPIDSTFSNASRIRISYHFVVSLYPDHNVVVKFCNIRQASSGKKMKKQLQKEVSALRAAKQIGQFKVPEIVLDHSCCNDDSIPAIWLKLIKENKLAKTTAWPDLAISMLRALFCMYEHNGIDFVLFDGLKDKVTQRKLLSFGWDDEEVVTILESLERLASCNQLVPKSFIHGDANISNCIIDERGELAIIDWEWYRWDYILFDVFNLERQGGYAVRKRYVEWLDKMSPSHQFVLDADIQSHIFCIERFMYLQNWRAALASKWNEKRAEKEIIKIKKKVMSAAGSLDEFVAATVGHLPAGSVNFDQPI